MLTKKRVGRKKCQKEIHFRQTLKKICHHDYHVDDRQNHYMDHHIHEECCVDHHNPHVDRHHVVPEWMDECKVSFHREADCHVQGAHLVVVVMVMRMMVMILNLRGRCGQTGVPN